MKHHKLNKSAGFTEDFGPSFGPQLHGYIEGHFEFEKTAM